MKDVDRIFEALKNRKNELGLTYETLAERMGRSHDSVKSLFSNRSCNLKRLEAICTALEIDFYTLAMRARGEKERISQLSVAQEQQLADKKNQSLLMLFHLLQEGWNKKRVLDEYDIDKDALDTLLRKLERLGLIRQDDSRVHLLFSPPVVWRRDGPVLKAYRDEGLRDFLGTQFSGDKELLKHEIREIPEIALLELRRKLEKLASEFHDLANDARQNEKRQNVGMVLAIRPWTFLKSSLARKGSRKTAERRDGSTTQTWAELLHSSLGRKGS